MSGGRDLTQGIPGSEIEPLPGTLLTNYWSRFLFQVRVLVVDLGTLTLSGVNKYNDSVMEYRYITVRPATCRVCSFHTMIKDHR